MSSSNAEIRSNKKVSTFLFIINLRDCNKEEGIKKNVVKREIRRNKKKIRVRGYKFFFVSSRGRTNQLEGNHYVC